MSDNGENVPPEVKHLKLRTLNPVMARALQESVVGKITEETAQYSLSQAEGEIDYAVDIILSQDTQQRLPTKEEVIRDLDSKFENKTETRQFACEKCDRYWWRKVPSRKQVSQCHRCKTKYDPIPHHQEWGWCEYKCENCGHEFNGFGSMGKPASSPCYQCSTQCFPVKVYPTNRPKKRDSNTRNTHSCDAPNCFHQAGRHRGHSTNNTNAPIRVNHAGGYGSNSSNTPNSVIYARGGSGHSSNSSNAPNSVSHAGGHSAHNVGECTHPRSRRKKVLVPSKQHVSTGSTVATFLSQGSLDDFFEMDLSDIEED